jgi:hypothetical protein
MISTDALAFRSLELSTYPENRIQTRSVGGYSRIYVVCQACDDGYGDYAFACKMGNTLQKIASHCQVILCGIDAPTHETLKQFAQHRVLRCLLAEKSVDFRKISPEILQNSLIVHGPVLKQPLSLPDTFPAESVWHIGEYSNDTPIHENIREAKSSGLGSDEWGIFSEKKQSDQNIIQKSFKNTILLQNVFNRNESPVYLAYCYDYRTVVSFIQLIVHANKDKDPCNITLCLPGDYKKIGFQKLLQEIPEVLLDDPKAPAHLEFIWNKNRSVSQDSLRSRSPTVQVLKKRRAGDVSIDYSETDQHRSLRWDFPGKPSRSTLKILFPGFVDSEDMQKLRVHSECACITGDQSFSDFLGMPILYECRPHKDKFFKSAIDLAKRHNLLHLARFWEQTHPFISQATLLHPSSPSNRDPLETMGLIDDPELQREAKLFGKIIYSQYNIMKKIAREFQKLERSKSPESVFFQDVLC